MPDESTTDMVHRGTREISLRNELGDVGFNVWARRNEKRLGYEDAQLALGLVQTDANVQVVTAQAGHVKAQTAYTDAKRQFWTMLAVAVLVATLCGLVAFVLWAVGS